METEYLKKWIAVYIETENLIEDKQIKINDLERDINKLESQTENAKKQFLKEMGNQKTVRVVWGNQLEDPTECMQKLLDCIRVQGSAAHAESVAKTLYDAEVSDNMEIYAVTDTLKDVGKANLKTIAQGKAAEYLGRANYAERLGRGLTHAIEGLRSIISMQKMEMEQTRYEHTGPDENNPRPY